MAKRSCDACVRRKSRCDSNRPCKPCIESKQRVECTYLNPILKRGPKSARNSRPTSRQQSAMARLLPNTKLPRAVENDTNKSLLTKQDGQAMLPPSVFAPILAVYKSRMYPVWPVLDADALMARLKASETSNRVGPGCYMLATALSAATIAQLKLGSEEIATQTVSAAILNTHCTRLRSESNYREQPSVDNVLTSFFQHVYHAKIDNRNAAMMYLQEAISFARILRMDIPKGASAHDDLIYILLWVSERGYAIQHGMPTSTRETVHTHRVHQCGYDMHQEGLLDLAELFAAFDMKSLQQIDQKSASLLLLPQELWYTKTTKQLARAHETLAKHNRGRQDCDLVQYADFYITKSWMRILLWQQAMKCGLLSSHASVESMTFMFPFLIARDLLESFTVMSEDHLLPLGRDQVVKSFEVTNTVADVFLCSLSSSSSGGSSAIWGRNNNQAPQFLHELFQTISPFLIDDKNLDEILRHKIGEALTQSPVKTLPRAMSGKDYIDEQFMDAEVLKMNHTDFVVEPFEEEWSLNASNWSLSWTNNDPSCGYV